MMPALERPSAMSLSTCCSRGVRRSIGVIAAADQELGDDLRVQGGAAGRHPVHRVQEVADVRAGP